MKPRKSRGSLAGRIAIVLAVAPGAPVAAYDVSKQFWIGGSASLAGQCQRLSWNASDEDRCRSALVFQPALSFHPSEANEFYLHLGFAPGNGLNDVTSFRIQPWAADLEDTVTDINGGRRDYLLTAWYRHAVRLGDDGSVAVTVGIIDSTDFVDTNAYSNDEQTQFMNGALVNGPNVFVPSYAPGLAVRWIEGRLSLTGVYMHVGRADDDSFDFYGVEIGYRLQTPLGEGNYRLLLDTTSPDFDEPAGDTRVRREAFLLSCDQRVARNLGLFLRISRQSDDAAIDYRALYSGGVDVGGAAWGRPRDNVGVGYAYLSGGNGDVERSRVAEAYYRLLVASPLALTADVQYMRDDLANERGPAGFVFGLRATTRF